MKATVFVFWFLFAATVVKAQTGVPLLDNWPFAPPGSSQSTETTAPEGPASLAKLQLRGITSIDGDYIFSVYNPDTRESKWIPQGQEQDGLLIKSYDPKKNTVVIHSEAENHSRMMQMNDYSAPTGIRATPPRPATLPSSSGTANRTTPQAVSPTGTLTRTQQSIQRPTRRNLETLRARRAELAEKLRKQPKPGETPAPGGTNQSNGGSR